MNVTAPDLRSRSRSTVSPETLILVTTADPSLREHRGDDLVVHPGLGRLIQPRHTSSIERTAASGIPWAADNDCFQGLDEGPYVRMLDRIVGLPGCLFVTVPDVVGDSDSTERLFARWIGELDRRGLPAALVAQDGLTADRIPWDRIACLFIGGSTEFKLGEDAAELAREAIRRGKLVHWGRVNSRRRFDYIISTGAATSFDGSKWARFRKTYLDGGLAWTLETATDQDPSSTGAHCAVAPVEDRPGSSRTTDREELHMASKTATRKASARKAIDAAREKTEKTGKAKADKSKGLAEVAAATPATEPTETETPVEEPIQVDLVATLVSEVEKKVAGIEETAPGKTGEFRIRLGKKTLAYVGSPGKRGSVRVHVTGAEGAPIVKVTDSESLSAAVSAIAGAADSIPKAEAPSA